MKNLFQTILCIFFLLPPFSGLAAGPPSELVILYTADVSGHTDPCG